MMDLYDSLSTLEKKVYDWLTKNNVLFSTQETMFGEAREIGSAVVDFVLPERNLCLRIMGAYWHSSMESKARDLLGKERLIAKGYQVVDLWEEDLADDKIQNTMSLALEGQEALH